MLRSATIPLGHRPASGMPRDGAAGYVTNVRRWVNRAKFHAMVLCRSGLLDSMLGLNRSQHLALLTRRLYHCLADHKLIQLRGSMLALALITLELETCCPDWLALTIDLLKKAQIDSSELIRSRELVAHSLSTLRASPPHNTVYIYQPLLSQTTLQQDPTLASCSLEMLNPTLESSRDHVRVTPTPVQPQTPAGEEEGSQHPWGSERSCVTNSNIPALLSPPKHLHHRKQLPKITLRSKASTKRKVEEMEVDDFYDGIKRLYNEDVTATPAVQEGGIASGAGGLSACSVLLSRQDGSSSPCPPLQPVSASKGPNRSLFTKTTFNLTSHSTPNQTLQTPSIGHSDGELPQQ